MKNSHHRRLRCRVASVRPSIRRLLARARGVVQECSGVARSAGAFAIAFAAARRLVGGRRCPLGKASD
jgi:hypothetical protein